MSNRIPRIQLDDADDEQGGVIKEILADRGKPEDGQLGNLFAMLVNSPQAARRMGAIGAYARFHVPVPSILREAAILTSCYRNNYEYEISAHEEIALDQGFDPHSLAALREGRWSDVDEQTALVGRFAEAVVSGQLVDHALVADVRRAFGDRVLIDLALSAAYYMLLHRVSNVVDPAADSAGHALSRPADEQVIAPQQ